MSGTEAAKIRRLPPWLGKNIPAETGRPLIDCLAELRLDTVCRGARCPNRLECLSRGQAAFLILGPRCTRACRFCAVESGNPEPPDPGEPFRLAEAVKRLGLAHAVITSVTRDDLSDGGAGHFARTAAAIRSRCPGVAVEILVPDFSGNPEAWRTAADCRPEVFNHNLETVARLYPGVRPGADFDRSLALLGFAKRRRPGVTTKSGLMLGLGEDFREVREAAGALRRAGVDMLTVGQYLRPAGGRALPVERFVPPEEFADLERELRGLGFAGVACSPFTRSSYRAGESFGAVSGRED
ncbi:MAG: lipoyl synthase [Planctomycetota bacterium]|jgi:lipoic acid synthetase|nr:lipoyl synthase [Planctomycetota bacterium]